MNVDEHMKAYQQHKDAIEWAINRGLDKSQRIVGTHASRKIVELFSAYLHSINKIDPGFQINHRWFKSPRAGDRFPDFPKKNIIIEKMTVLENISEALTYQSQKDEKEIRKVIELSNDLENTINDAMNAEGRAGSDEK